MIQLRPALISDLKTLEFWDTQQHVIDSDPNDDWNWSVELRRNPPWREHLMAELDRLPIGFVQIIDPFLEETHYWGNVEENKRAIDIWIGEERNLGKGYGTVIMKMAIERCFRIPAVSGILIDPLARNVKAHRFYERLGFKLKEQRTFNVDDCLVYELTRARS